MGAGVVDADMVDADFDECFVVRPFLVLYGLAAGARFMVPSGFVAGLVVGCFLVAVVCIAYDTRPAETVSRRSDLEMCRNAIYCTPISFAALCGWVEVAEMTGAGSFGWGPGCVCMYLS